MPDGDLQWYPLWPVLRGDMLFLPVYPQANTAPHYVSLAQLKGYIGVGGGLDLDSPAFTGSPTAPTPPYGDDSTRLATTGFVQDALAGIVVSGGGVPEAPTDGQAYGRGSSAWSPVLPLRGGTLSGDLTVTGVTALNGGATAPTVATGDNSTSIATTAWVRAQGYGGSSVTIADGAPLDPSPGDLWWSSAAGEGQLFIFYEDVDSAAWVIANAAPTVAPKYNLGFSYVGGVLAASQLLGLHKLTKPITIAADFGSYLGHLSEAGGTATATATTVVSVDRAVAASPNSFTQIGTITFAAGTVTPTFATASGAAVACAQGDVLRVVGPATADSTFANFYCTLVAQEQ